MGMNGNGIIAAMFALACIGVSPAQATGCPSNTVWNGWQCIAPQGGGEIGSTNTNTATGVGIGVGTGIGHGGAGGHATGGRGGSATAGVRGSGNSDSISAASANNRISIDNRTHQAAAQAAPVIMGGYGSQNCFGDTNPSGQFGASMQVFGWGVSANSSKASNVCALAQLAGPAAAIGYMQKMDPNVPRAVTVMQPTGRVTCPASHPVYVEGKGCRK